MEKTRIILREEEHRSYAINRVRAAPLGMEVIIQPHKANRSLDQNALYWKWVSIMGPELGYSKEELHETLMRKHLPPRIVETMSGPVEVYTTTKLSVKEMSDYMERVSFTAGEMGVGLPAL